MKVTGYKVDCLSPWQPKLHSAIFLACAAERKCCVPFRANEMIFRGFYTKQGRVRVSHLFQNVHGRHILQLRLSGTKEFQTSHHFKEIVISWQNFQVKVDREVAVARRMDLSLVVQNSTLANWLTPTMQLGCNHDCSRSSLLAFNECYDRCLQFWPISD